MILEHYKEFNGIKIFNENINEDHQDYNAKGLDNIFAQEEKHFWFIARKEFIYIQMLKFISKVSKIIEIGAGTGNVSRYLKYNGYKNICAGEMHLNGLEYAINYGIENCYQFDLLRAPFENEFDTVCLFDVLEHIEDDTVALENIWRMLTIEGSLILTVPAHKWLWNRDDAIAKHKRRYTKNELIKKLENNGFDILVSRYFFIIIVPLLFLRRIFNRDDGRDMTMAEYDKEIVMDPISNAVLLLLSRIENRLNAFLPNFFGGSLFIIARKK